MQTGGEHFSSFYKVVCCFIILSLCWVHATKWPCPGGQTCITIPDFWRMPPLVRPEFLQMWDSDCQEICAIGYGVVPLHDNLNQQCILLDALKENKTWIPTQLWSCDVDTDNFVCRENFYFSENSQTCVECSLVKHKCAIGFYYERCQKGELVCHPCSNPIPNASSQIYGEYTGHVPSCTTLHPSERFSMDARGIPSCIPFLTPWWDEYKCPLHCQYNYINIGAPGSGECVPCYEKQRCPPGQRCGGLEAVDDRKCYSCGELPGPNQQWLPNTDVFTSCRFGCADGFYDDDKTEIVHCVACHESQSCVDDYKVYFGCHGESRGSCRPPTEPCVQGETFLYYRTSSVFTECRNCSRPVLGITFEVSACDVTQNSDVQPCSKTCPVGSFKTHDCSLDADIQCQQCSNPLEKKGLLMVEGGCNGEKDYTFVSCPDGYACDGSTIPKKCAHPKRAVAGLCVCPPNTVLRDGNCAMVQCASGFYPHPDTGDCMPCSPNPQHTITLDALWGKEACACEPGYFIQKLNHSSWAIRCWPCGDLTCLPETEYQTPCSGGSTEEPSCQCKAPPGVSSSNECQITGCESGLRQSPAFSSFASGKAQLWNSSFWVTDQKMESKDHETLLASDSAEISSVALIDQNTVVYIVNRVSLRIVSRPNATAPWQRGTIENSLFIRGNRALASHALVDMSVCRDSVRMRFWVSFVMLTTACGDFSGMNNELRTCSNFELIEIKSRPEPGCVTIIGTSLCAENMFLIWGKTISEGIPLLRIFSMTLNFVAANGGEYHLYMAMGLEGSNGATEMYVYRVHYHAANTPFKDRIDDGILPFSTLSATSDLSHLVWIENHFFGLGGGLLTHLTVRGTNNKIAGVGRILKHFERIPLTCITKGGDKALLLGLSAGTEARVYEADLWNGWVLQRVSQQRSPIFLLASNEVMLSVYKVRNATLALWVYGQSTCPMDQLATNGRCTIQPCLLLDGACGPHSIRHVGQRLCSCLPGYYLPTGQNRCQICPADHFCSADRDGPVKCMNNALSITGASSSLQCNCAKGFYMQEDLCVQCPMGYWCMGKNYPPVQCGGGSTTQYMGISSPVACGCQARTYDLDCKPCASSDLCLLLGMDKQPKIAAVYLRGSGPLDAELFLNRSCLTWGLSIVYQIPLSLSVMASVVQGKIWTWVVVTEPLPNQADESGLVQNISSCLLARNFSLDEAFVYTPVVSTLNVKRSVPCSLNYEWSGDVRTQECICIGGYETAKDKNLFDFCSPCKVGTMRARMSPKKCTACADNNSHAPWLGMDHCVCKNGFFMDPVTKACVTISPAFPSYTVISSPFLVIPLSLGLVLLCMLSVCLISFYT